MANSKSLLPGSAGMLLLQLLSEGDLYGYQMTEELRRRSDDTFVMKAGTLYPILHGLEQEGKVESYERQGEGGAPASRAAIITSPAPGGRPCASSAANGIASRGR